VLSGNVLIADSVIRGGRGGAGSNPLNCCNASGGPGLRLGNDFPTVTVRGATIQSGFPGADMGCAPFLPAIDVLSGTLLNETGATPSGGFATEWAYSGGMSAIVARAEVGQNAFVGFSFGTATTPIPLAKGDLLLASPLLIIVPLGMANGFTSGVESAVPFLPPGSAPIDLFAQTLSGDPIDGPILGPRDRTRILDMASALAGTADCDQDGVTDAYTIWSGLDTDDDRNGIPDGCEAPLTLYVDDDAPNDPLPGSTAGSDPLADGSLAHPFDNLQAAVNASASTNFAVIELLPGTYSGPGNVGLVLQNRQLKIRGMSAATTVFDLQQQAPLLRIEQSSRVTLQGFAIVDGATTTASGGAIYANNVALRLRDMRLENNRAQAGGAIYSYQTDLSVTNTAFLYNHASDDGGAIYENGPNSYQANTLGLRMVDCELFGNTAGSEGGALFTANKTVGPRVASSNFVGNSADLNGGAVYCTSSTTVFESCHFGDNAAAYYGGAFFSLRTSTPFYLKPMTLRQCTLRGNYAFIQGAALNTYGATLLGCVIWENTIEPSILPVAIAPNGNFAASYFFQGAFPTPEFVLRDTTIQGGIAGIPTNGSVEVIDGPGNQNVDPLFASANAADPSLAPGSPAIDTGGATWVPPFGATDVEGDPRFVGPHIDRGADEFKP
jgi:predicted outer membrane repeat protein